MKDVDGKEIKVGSKVVTNLAGYTHELVIAKVESFTSKKVKIIVNSGFVYKFPGQLAIIS